MVLVDILLIAAKLEIVMLRKPAGFYKILCDVMISRQEIIVNDMTRHFYYDVKDL